MPIFVTVTEREFKGESQAQNRILIEAMLRSGFFPQNALGDSPAFWILFPGFTDKG